MKETQRAEANRIPRFRALAWLTPSGLQMRCSKRRFACGFASAAQDHNRLCRHQPLAIDGAEQPRQCTGGVLSDGRDHDSDIRRGCEVARSPLARPENYQVPSVLRRAMAGGKVHDCHKRQEQPGVDVSVRAALA
eukprot:scaffold3651_cov61-Phaeocystis_antarctica.AAC.3